MATHSVDFYEGRPFDNGFIFGQPGTTFTYTGSNTATGSMDVTDNGTGTNGEVLSSNDSATANATINGLTSTGSDVDAGAGFLIEDSVTGQRFSVIQLNIASGDAAGGYTLSEVPLVAGRTYILRGWGSSTPANSPGAFTYSEYVCFATGTLIDTPDGPRDVETLAIGDPITTLDHGAQPIIWRSARRLHLGPENEGQKPILLKRDSLGPGCPEADLVVSPQHRILLDPRGGCAQSDGREVFGAAKALAGQHGIRIMRGKRIVTYHTLMTSRHEIIFANGMGVETFYPGPQSLSVLSAQERRDLEARVPSAALGCALTPSIAALRILKYGPLARRVLRPRAIRQLGAAQGVNLRSVAAA
ncbi:Hint domain-containing protein [Gymnodinialimonas ulvae]|uniref:Hint domain-containing protein n=1 Tax=Gymnodinialimonas ulvae TaxID=3126504 RepID=UPI0030AC6F05